MFFPYLKFQERTECTSIALTGCNPGFFFLRKMDTTNTTKIAVITITSSLLLTANYMAVTLKLS